MKDQISKQRFIIVENCKGCPYYRYNDGQGYTGEFEKCIKYNILLNDSDSNKRYFDVTTKTHKKCELDLIDNKARLAK